MNPIKNFNDYQKDGIVKKRYPDLSKANFLIKESEKGYSFINSIIKNIGLNEENANSIVKLCYDTLMELIRAKMLLNGYKAVGMGAHEAEVAYLREINFNENDIQFADKLRYNRNGILYYGVIFDKEYAEKVLEFMKKTHPRLMDILKPKPK